MPQQLAPRRPRFIVSAHNCIHSRTTRRGKHWELTAGDIWSDELNSGEDDGREESCGDEACVVIRPGMFYTHCVMNDPHATLKAPYLNFTALVSLRTTVFKATYTLSFWYPISRARNWPKPSDFMTKICLSWGISDVTSCNALSSRFGTYLTSRRVTL